MNSRQVKFEALRREDTRRRQAQRLTFVDGYDPFGSLEDVRERAQERLKRYNAIRTRAASFISQKAADDCPLQYSESVPVAAEGTDVSAHLVEQGGD